MDLGSASGIVNSIAGNIPFIGGIITGFANIVFGIAAAKNAKEQGKLIEGIEEEYQRRAIANAEQLEREGLEAQEAATDELKRQGRKVAIALVVAIVMLIGAKVIKRKAV